jgi:hypothetical protein
VRVGLNFEVSVDLGFDPLILYLNCVGLGIIYLPKFAGHLDLVKVIHQIMVLDLSEKKKKKKTSRPHLLGFL